ncbi:MAG: YkgJ family cysteine cluster protein [Promethearchaeota archaeon]
MSENNQEKEIPEKEEPKPEEKKTEPKEKEVETEQPEQKEEATKTKFTFKCTRCDDCCLARGPIPITSWDLEMWARNGVVANFMPYLDLYIKPDGSFDLILKPLPPTKEEDEKEQTQEPFSETSVSELLEAKCPMYNIEQKKCLIYENRPLSCRTYPLEYDGKHYSVIDLDCPGVGEEGMTKEELAEMRETAKTMNYELTRIRIGLPVLNQIISNNFMKMLLKQQIEAMSKMSDEDRSKLDEIFKKQEEAHDHTHDNEQEH